MRFSLSIALAVALIGYEARAQNLSIPTILSTTANRADSPSKALEAGSSASSSQNLLGRGYNGLSGELRGICATGRVISAGNEGKRIDYSLHLASSAEEFRRNVNMSAGASFGLGTWSTDAAVSYFQSAARSRYVDNLIVRVTVSGPTLSFEPAGLTDAAAKFLRDQNSFYRVCGNRYVRSLSMGGEFIATIKIETTSETERSELQSTLSVIAKGYGSASASYQEAMSRLNRFTQKDVKILRNGTNDQVPNLEIDALIKYSQEFPTRITATTGVPVGIEFADYQTINPIVETYRAQEILVEAMSNRFGELFETTGDLQYYARNKQVRTFYPPLSEEEIQKSLTALSAASIQAKLAFAACVDKPKSSCELAAFPSSDIDGPRLAQQVALDPKTGADQPIGSAGRNETKRIVVLGNWSAWDNGENLWWPPERCCFKVVISPEAGTRSEINYSGPLSFQGPAQVSVRIEDSVHGDNRGRGLVAIVY